MDSGYFANNLLTEMSALRARVAALEKALTAVRAGGGLGANATALITGMSGDTPTAALPRAEDIPPVYFLDAETRIIWQGVVRWVNGKERFYLQRIGRVRE